MAAAKSAQEGLCELLDDSIGSDGFDPREASTKSKQASSAKSPLVVKRKPTSNSNANARQPQHKDAKTMLPKPLETPGSDDDDDNDQLSGLDDSVDEALIVCHIKGCSDMFVHARDYYQHLQQHSVPLKLKLAQQLQHSPPPFHNHKPLCGNCGDVLDAVNDHINGCGDAEVTWQITDAPVHLITDIPIHVMARARRLGTSRLLNKRATNMFTTLKTKLTLYVVDTLKSDDVNAEGFCKLFFLLDAMVLNLERSGLSTTTAVVSRCYQVAGNNEDDWREMIEAVTGYRPRRTSQLEAKQAAFQRADKLASNGEVSQAAQAIYQAGSESLATSSHHNDLAFAAKFKSRNTNDHLDLQLNPAELEAPPDAVVVKALDSLKRQKAYGTFGETTEGLRFIDEQALCKLVQACFHYTLPDIFHRLAGASFGNKLGKTDGGIRPINVSTSINKLLSKTLVVWGLSELCQQYRTTAKGIGEPAGTETILHLVEFMLRDSYNKRQDTHDLLLIKADIKNCFNSAKRDKLFEVLLKHGFGSRMGAVKALLGHSHTVIHVDYQGQTSVAVEVNDGTFQGSPASGFFVTLLIQHQLTQLRQKYLEDANVPAAMFSFLDDITVCADLTTLETVFPLMQHALLEVGFEVSLAKTTLVTFNKGVQAERDTAARLGIAIEQGVTSLLGSCLYLESRLAKKHLNRLWDQWELEWTNLKAYAHGDGPHRLQVALRVLRQSFSAKAAYLSRCLPAHLAAPIAQRFHQRLVLPMLDNILGARTTAFVKLHATLPTRFGGLGIGDSEALVHAAYYSSWNDVLRQVFDGAVPTYLVARFSDLKAKYNTFRWPEEILKSLSAAKEGVQAQIEALAGYQSENRAAALKVIKAVSAKCLPAVRDLGTVDRKLQERIQQHVLAPLAKAEAEDQLFDDRAMETLGYAPEEIDLVRAKWTELRAPGAQDWLKALPVHPDLELPNELLRTTLAHHLLVPRKTFLRVVGVPELLHTGCLCGLSDDKPLTEQHMAGCAHGGHRTERHDRVVRLVGSLAKHAGCSRVVIEPRGLRNYGQQRPDLMYKDNNLAGKKKTVVVDVAVASTLPSGANHLRKALEDPLYKAKLTMQRKVKENGKRMSSTQRFVPMVLQSTGGYCSNVSNFCRHPGLRTLELPSALRERLASPLDTMSSFLKLQLVMRVVKGTACNMVRLMERLCREYGEPEDHGGDD